MIYGYACGVPGDRGIAKRIAALKANGAETIVQEKAPFGGKLPQLAIAIDKLQPNDVLMVYGLNTMFNGIKRFHRLLVDIAERQAGFRSLEEPWAEMIGKNGRTVLKIVAGMADLDYRQRATRFAPKPADTTPGKRRMKTSGDHAQSAAAE